MCPVVLDVHLVQSSLGGGVLHCDRPVQVVRDQRLGRFPRRHQDLACKRGAEPTSEKKCLATRDKPSFRHDVVSPVISPLRKENGITMSKGLKPLPFTLLLVGSYLSDVTLRKTRGTRSEVGPARRLAARETHAAATARPRTLAPSWEVEVQSRRGG